MGSHGGVGNKFVSVNLNKSFGQSAYNHNHSPHYNGSYGQAAASRLRPGSHGGGGDGMVVLSRPRSSQKAAPKLSVPPPLNLPSFRKEHEKFDLSEPGSGSAGGAGSGSGLRPNVSGFGWTKPGAIALQENNGNGDALVADGLDQSIRATDVVKGSSSYVPPSARLAGAGLAVTATSQSNMPPAEKTMVLRGEDFPSLKAALPTKSGPVQKPRDNSQQKLKQGLSEESSDEQKDNCHLNLIHHMRPQGQHAYSTNSNGFNANGNQGFRFGSSHMADQARKQEDYPLPLVRLNPRSDWADDERDTGHGFADRARDHRFTKSEAYWDRDFDLPRTTTVPQKPLNNTFERWSQRGDETGKGPFSEVLKMDPYSTDVRIPRREGNNWRTYPLQRDGFNVQEVVNDRSASVQSIGINRDTGRGNKYIPPRFGDGHWDGGVTGNGESALGRIDTGNGQEGRQHWNHVVEFSNPASERRDRFGAEQSSRYRRDNLQNRTVSKLSFSSGGFNQEKLPLPKSDIPYLEDPLLKDFVSTDYDERDPFSGGLVGVIKRKKDVVKQADFHDPVGESFEAELERVQKLQEIERQWIIEEQERVLEQVRREEVERLQLIREEEERRRRLEEEAREAAWRAEQERLEVIRRAEEQKIAREEEKKRILIEEERRKQAAKQKLLELEAKISQRQAEAEKGDSSVAAVANEKDVLGAEDLDDWEDSERMVERITTSASSDSSVLNRPFATSCRFPPEKSSSGYLERGKSFNSWRRNEYENGNNSSFSLQDEDNGHQSYRRDASVGVRAYPRKEFYGAGHIASNTYPNGGLQESHIGEYAHPKEHRWSPSVDADPFNKNRGIGLGSYENISERYSDAEWGQSHIRGNPHSPYPEGMYPNSEADEHYSYGRSRYSMRQPRVLPPPSIASLHKTSFRGETEHPGSSTSLGNDNHYNYVAISESAMQTEYYDESDESADSVAMLASAEEKDIVLSGNDSIILNKSGKDTMMTVSSSISAGEDEEWTLEKTDEMQEQEEYDEDGYQEDEVHEVDDENVDLTLEFEDMHLEEIGSSHMMDNLVLGFDEGVEVGLPSDESERNPKSEGNNLERPEISVGIVKDRGFVDGTIGDQESLHPMDCLPQTSSESASRRIDETEKSIQESVIQPINAPPTSMASDLLNDSIPCSGSGLSAQHKVPSSVDMALSPSSSGQPTNSAVSSAPNQADLPVKLQFGLFTGPSLIPSPVPSIQIGSIQMPLHLHLPVDPSITHLQSSQPPLFQFGQLRYTSPISRGILPMAPQSMSFVQPSIHHHYSLNQNSGGSQPIQPGEDTHTHNLMKDDVSSLSINNQPAGISRALNLSDENSSRVLNSFSVSGMADTSALVQKTGTDFPQAVDNLHMLESILQAEDKEQHDSVVNFGQSDEKGPEVQLQSAAAQFVSREEDFNVSKGQGPLSGNKAKKLPYSVRNYGLRSSYTTPAAPRLDSSGFQRRLRRTIQRTEFRIGRSSGLVPSNNSWFDNNSNLNGTSSGFKRGSITTKPLKQVVESESLSSGPVNSQEIDSESKVAKGFVKEGLPSSRGIPLSREGNMKRNTSEEDVDAPSQSGVVHVFTQSGIEAPSDEDDFIEVRSKRQMLNDRREQREKEIKARSQVTKAPRKPRSSAQSTVVSTSSNKISASMGRKASSYTCSSFLVSEGKGTVNKEVTTGFASKASQQLAPIGTPAVAADFQAEIRSHAKSLQTGSVPVVSGVGKEIGPGLIFDPKDKVLDTVQTPLGPWGNARISQQVMALTQTQLDEAMSPARFETHVTPIGGHTTLVSEPMPASSSILVKDKLMSSSASPINSLLAGERIQFGAVTSPTVLPPSSSHVVSLGIGAPGSFRPDIQKLHNISNPKSNLFSGNDKCPEESCSHLQDCEDEAEAAASDVAVVAMSSDKIVGNGLSSVSISDANKFRGPDVHGIAGVASDHQSVTKSRAEESLSVSLPADLSVETQPISLWSPLPSPHNPSSQMLSHFPGAPSHFPFYEMNSMLGGPIFAFSPHEESGGTQSQSQKSTVSGPGHLGTWQQCRPTMDSFYGPPAGFTGPFISPPGGIPGVQAPPHMVVYNRYARVGQFGQVGLSFMGTTYIPSGKQPDWKNNHASSGLGISEGEMTNMNMVSAQHNPPNMPAQMQHLGPGSPLLPMASPFGMFDVSPFQSAPPDMSVQGHWPHVPASHFHSVPLSLPLQQQAEGVLPSQFRHQHPVEQSLIGNRFSESQSTAPSNSDQTCPVVMDTRLTQFSDKLVLVDSLSYTTAGPSTQSAVNLSSSESAIANAGKGEAAQNVGSNTSNGPNSFKPRHSQQFFLSSQQFNHSTDYGHQRGGVAQKRSSAGEWSQRRMGFHRRNQSKSAGAEKNFPNSKVRQIYVAKQTSGSSSTVP